MSEDIFNFDGTVDVKVRGYMKMSALDYKIMWSLYFLKEEEKEALLMKVIPKITKDRVVLGANEIEAMKKGNYRLRNIEVFMK